MDKTVKEIYKNFFAGNNAWEQRENFIKYHKLIKQYSNSIVPRNSIPFSSGISYIWEEEEQKEWFIKQFMGPEWKELEDEGLHEYDWYKYRLDL